MSRPTIGDLDVAAMILTLVGLALLLAFPWGIYVFIPVAAFSGVVFVRELLPLLRPLR